MLLLLIVPLLISGLQYSRYHPYHFYRLHRQEGQYLYIHATYLGTKCLAASIGFLGLLTLLLYPLDYYFSFNYIRATAQLLKHQLYLPFNDAIKVTWYLYISAVSIFLTPYFFAQIYIYKYRKDFTSKKTYKIVILGDLLKENPLDYLLFNATINEQHVMLSMQDRKVYVGQIIRMGEPNETQAAAQEVEIKPAISGYRDKDTLAVTFNTRYMAIDRDITLVIRQNEILSATYFDQDVFDTFQKTVH